MSGRPFRRALEHVTQHVGEPFPARSGHGPEPVDRGLANPNGDDSPRLCRLLFTSHASKVMPDVYVVKGNLRA